ncbi:MAG: phosphatidylserine decarboxylase [Synechococcaceae cyanobacterium]|nr:phosphatidylserine decarboxylase [Synechococcaceae cyanobacterium]
MTTPAQAAPALRAERLLHPVVEAFRRLVREQGWEDRLERAIALARRFGIREVDPITDGEAFLLWLQELLHWVPTENERSRGLLDRLCTFYFVLDQPPLRELQNPLVPAHAAAPLTPLSAWIVAFAAAIGTFLDQPGSLTPESLATFRAAPAYCLDDYLEPHGGWMSFNQFFARHVRPGLRPIAALSDPAVIVSPVDCTFLGQWEIHADSRIDVKGLEWSIRELLEGSPHADRFAGGLFMHAFLNTTDYHRLHAPVAGRVLESRVIPGQAMLKVVAEPVTAAEDPLGVTPASHRLRGRRYDPRDETGFQFTQARGLVVLATPIGLVAVLPVGMAQVSSVILTAREGVTLRKGEEIGYFQFGSSDVVVVFEAASNVCLTAQVGVHYRMGRRLGQADPVLSPSMISAPA